MGVLLIIGFFVANVFWHTCHGQGLRIAFVYAYLTTFLVILTTTEIASLFNAITYQFALILWGLLFVSAVFILVRFRQKKCSSALQNTWQSLWDTFQASGRWTKLTLLLIGCVFTITAIIALWSPPNNWDSMTYHMARVAEWIDHKNIRYYPTAIVRQNYQMPLAEFGILHLQLLANSDRFANMVQWGSGLMAVLLVTLITQEIGGGVLAQAFSAAFVSTMPMFILQSTSTQNDIVTGTLTASFAYFLLQFYDRPSLSHAVSSGISLGLALFTKGTAYIFCAGVGLPIAIGTLWNLRLEKKNFSRALINLIFILLLGLVLNTGYFVRSYQQYHAPLPPIPTYHNAEISASVFFSNLMRNMGLHLGTPFTSLNRSIYHGFQKILGSELNNPKSTWPRQRFKIRFSLHEDFAGNLPHLILTLFGFPLVFFCKRKKIFLYMSTLILSAILFALLLRWQPWGSRLHTPWFILSAPLTSTILDSTFLRPLNSTAVALLFIYSLPALLINPSRPLIPFDRELAKMDTRVLLTNLGDPRQFLRNYEGRAIWNTPRSMLYFMNRPELYTDYKNTAQFLVANKATRVGLYIGGDDWEYPLWALTVHHMPPIHFQHVLVGKKYPTQNKGITQHLPDFIVTTKKYPDEMPLLFTKYYSVVSQGKYLTLLKKSYP